MSEATQQTGAPQVNAGEKSAAPGPRDAAMAASEAFAAVRDQTFPTDIFTAPQLTWAVIGCGVIANQMAQSMALAGRRIHGVANRTRSKAEAFAQRYGVERVYNSAEELYQDPAVDAVYITTPHNTHIRYLRGALAAGKNVLCEKSITLNSEELAEARELASQNHVVLMDATTILHMPLYQELLRRMRAGEFGRMNLAQLNFGSYKEYGDLTNRFYNINLAGGAMLDIGVYALSLMRLFMDGAPTEVVSLGNLAKTGVDEAGGIVCRNAQGQLGVVSLTLHSKQPKRAVLSFDRCYIEVMDYPRADRATIVWTADGHREEVRAGVEGYALCYEMADLESAVAGDASKAALLGYASDVMDVMTKVRRSWGVVYPEER
jgi:predicted dehydrogenase